MSITIEEISKQDLSRILSNQLDVLDTDESVELELFDNYEQDEDLETIRLSELSAQETQSLEVSDSSKFGDAIWEMAAHTNIVTKGVTKLVFDEAESILLIEMLKHWCFYRLPLTTGNRVQMRIPLKMITLCD